MGYRLVSKNSEELKHGSLFNATKRVIRSNYAANKADKNDYSSMSYDQMESEKARLESRISEANTKLIAAQANRDKYKQEYERWFNAVETLKNDKAACEQRIGKLRQRMVSQYSAR